MNINVFFLNSIVAVAPYGAKAVASRLTLVDSLGNNAFSSQGGSLNVRNLTAPNLDGKAVTENVAEQDGVVYLTCPVTAANTAYGFSLNQYNPYTGDTLTANISVNTGVGMSQAQVVAAWHAQLSAAGLFVTIAEASPVLHVTAIAGYPILTGSGGVGGVTVTQHTAPIVGVGNATDMTALNGYGSSWSSYAGYVIANTYDRVWFKYTDSNNVEWLNVIFVNVNDASYANFKTSFYVNILQQGAGGWAALTYLEATSVEDPSIGL